MGLAEEVGLVCRCMRCCCPPGRGHNHPRYDEYLATLRACPNDTDGDGDCASCARLPGGCQHMASSTLARRTFPFDASTTH